MSDKIPSVWFLIELQTNYKHFFVQIQIPIIGSKSTIQPNQQELIASNNIMNTLIRLQLIVCCLQPHAACNRSTPDSHHFNGYFIQIVSTRKGKAFEMQNGFHSFY